MKRLTWWQRTAASRYDPRIWVVPFFMLGVAIIAYSLMRYGFGNALLHKDLVVGASGGLVTALFWKWLLRRYHRYYVDRELGLRPYEMGIVMLQSAFMALLVVGTGIARDLWGGQWVWAVSGAYLLTLSVIYPETKELHEGIKAKLAEMESTP